jgi:hypothetical protein
LKPWLAWGLLTLLIVSGCDQVGASPVPSEHLLPPATMDVAPAAYFEAAWLSDDAIALARPEPGRNSTIVLVHSNGQEIGTVDRPKPPHCDGQIFSALSRLGTGELGIAEECEIDATGETRSTFLAYDPLTTNVRELGPASERPKVAVWSPGNVHAWYTAEGSLCATIYEFRADQGGPPSDHPSSITVDAQGHSFPLGEDLAAAPDHCTRLARTDYPALGSGDELSAFVSFAGGKEGQERIDLPWALVSIRAEQTETVLDGVVEPRGLWLAADDAYTFSGRIGGLLGLWRIRPDGTGLTTLSDEDLTLLAMSPDAKHVVAIVQGELTPNPQAQPSMVVTYDLTPVLESN